MERDERERKRITKLLLEKFDGKDAISMLLWFDEEFFVGHEGEVAKILIKHTKAATSEQRLILLGKLKGDVRELLLAAEKCGVPQLALAMLQ